MKSLLRNDVFKIVVFVSATLLLGALLTAPIYWAAKAIVAEGWLIDGPLQSIHDSLERAKLSRCFNRAMMAAALIFGCCQLTFELGVCPVCTGKYDIHGIAAKHPT